MDHLDAHGPDWLNRLRARTYDLLEPQPDDGLVDKFFNVFIVSLILANVLAVMFETVDAYRNEYALHFALFEAFSIAFFSIEYLLRWWTAVENPNFGHPVVGRLKYLLSPPALIDALALAPFYLALVFGLDLRVLQVLRIFRAFMLLKLARYSKALRMLFTVVGKQKETLLVTLTMGLVLLVFASSVIYYIEHPVQPEAYPNIPAAMWWGVVSLTTVGYGDVYPVTTLGRVFNGLIAVIGVGLFALPAGLLASGFAEELQAQREELKRRQEAQEQGCCPHCRRPWEDPPQQAAS